MLRVSVVAIASIAALVSTDAITLTNAKDAADVGIKTIGLLAGAVWALNRHLVTRADAKHLRVDAVVQVLPTSDPTAALLIARLDVVNTSATLIPYLEQRVVVEAVRLADSALQYDSIYQWPDEGFEKSGRLEPSSWAALNFEAPVSSAADAVIVNLYVQLPDKTAWSWVRTFPALPKGIGSGTTS